MLVVPGDRDWRRGEDGVKRLEALLDSAFGGDVLTPGDQAGGPREMEPAEGLRLVALDTAWWLLDPDEQPAGEAEDQDVRSPSDVARIFEQILVDRDDDRVVVLAHHPLISRGPYAGYRVDPLSGFVAQTLGTGTQDLSSPRYRQLRAGLGGLAAGHDRLVWAASHDRILMTHLDVVNTLRQQVHLVSGTGGGEVATSGASGALAVASRPGYQRLVYYEDGRLWAETVEVDPATGASEVTFRVEVAGPNAELVDTQVPDLVDPADLPDDIGGTVTLAADEDFVTERFSTGAFTRALFGDNYRDVWKTDVEFPVLDLGTEAGGLVPVKRGGGLQTTSLRLLGADGHEYGLRLLEKSGLAQVPYALRDGLVGDVVLELRAAMAPYGALVASPLARAVGVAQPDPHHRLRPRRPAPGPLPRDVRRPAGALRGPARRRRLGRARLRGHDRRGLGGQAARGVARGPGPPRRPAGLPPRAPARPAHLRLGPPRRPVAVGRLRARRAGPDADRRRRHQGQGLRPHRARPRLRLLRHRRPAPAGAPEVRPPAPAVRGRLRQHPGPDPERVLPGPPLPRRPRPRRLARDRPGRAGRAHRRRHRAGRARAPGPDLRPGGRLLDLVAQGPPRPARRGGRRLLPAARPAPSTCSAATSASCSRPSASRTARWT